MSWKDTITPVTPDDGAPAAPAAKTASWKDTITPVDDAPAEEPGFFDKLKSGAKQLTSGMSLPRSLSEIPDRLAHDGLLRPAPKEKPAGTEVNLQDAVTATANSAPMYPFFSGGGLANVGARVGANTAIGGVQGGLSNPDKSFDWDKAKDGAKLSAALSLLGEGAGGLSGAASDPLNDVAESRSASAMGWTKALRKKFGRDAAHEAGRIGLDEGVVTPFASTADKLDRIGDLQARAGKTIGNTMDTLDKAGVKEFVPGDTAMQVDSQLGGKYAGEPLFKGQADQYENLIDTILKRGDGPIPYSKAQNLKQMIGDYGYKEGIAVPGREQAQQAYGIVNKELDNAVDRGAQQLGDENLLGDLQKARKDYSAANNTTEALTGKQAGEEGNQQFGLGPKVLVAPMLAGGPLGVAKAAATVGLHSAAARYGNNVAAVGADALSKLLKDSPEVLGRYAPVLTSAMQRGGPDALTAAHHTLLKTDPNYAKQLNGDGAP